MARGWKLGMDWSHLPPAPDSGKWMVDSYPADIRAWIDAKVGYAAVRRIA
jgi:hypothetical protein